MSAAALFPFAAVVEIIAPSYLSLWLNSKALRLLGVDNPLYIAEVISIIHPAKSCIKRQITQQHFNMYSNKNEGPRRGRSFDSMNIGFEEKLLNNEVRTSSLFLFFSKKTSNSFKYLEAALVFCPLSRFVVV